MSLLKEENSFASLGSGKWGRIVVNADGTAVSAGGGGGGGASTIADGADVTQGAIADAAVATGATGTVSAKLRRISTDIGTLSTNTPAVGQAAMAASSPVVIASNQATFPVTAAGTAASNAAASGNPVMVGGRYNASNQTFDDGDVSNLQSDVNGFLRNREQYQPGYEDNTNNKAIVEHRYSVTRVTADTQIKASAGFVHTVSIAPTTATPTAGLLTVFDNTAGSGTALYSEWIFATTPGHSVILDCATGTGIYVEYDATLANVSCSVTWR